MRGVGSGTLVNLPDQQQSLLIDIFCFSNVIFWQEYVVEGESSVVWEAVTHGQSSKIALMYPWIHSCDLQTARDEPCSCYQSCPLCASVTPLCPSRISILHLSHPSFNRWFSSTEILNLILKQKNHPIFPTSFLSSLSSLLPMEVFEVAQVPEKGIFFSPSVLWLCVPSSLYLPFVTLFCLPHIYVSPHLFTLLQGSFFINMLISSPGIFLASHRSPGRARREEGREREEGDGSRAVIYDGTGQQGM